MKRFISMFMPGYPKALVYMLQSTEYEVFPYIAWYWRVNDFSTIMYRRTLQKTKAAQLLLWAASVGIILQIIIGLCLSWYGYTQSSPMFMLVGLFIFLSYPPIWAYMITVPIWVGRILIVNPRQKKNIERAEQIFANHRGVKIAVAGSYGKTTMKELLKQVLGAGKKVAATPANKNVSSSHAIFASKLSGDEDILIIEYGEGAPGDVARFSANTHPSHAVITGLAPAHLDHYPTLESAGIDIFSVAEYVGDENTYVNADSSASKTFIKEGMHTYSSHGVLGWKVSDIHVAVDHTRFVMKKDKKTLSLTTGLLGRHQVGPVALAAALADTFGLNQEQIVAAIAETQPFEHRMQSRAIHGAWILDDTYNGNIDGMKAGLGLLSELPGKRKIYVTPGLVDQGQETENVHIELGKAIAAARPDKVVLMLNSVTEIIQKGMKDGGYKGEVQIEHYPLDFYVNLEHFIAAGDVVMLQNDWTDNYN